VLEAGGRNAGCASSSNRGRTSPRASSARAVPAQRFVIGSAACRTWVTLLLVAAKIPKPPVKGRSCTRPERLWGSRRARRWNSSRSPVEHTRCSQPNPRIVGVTHLSPSKRGEHREGRDRFRQPRSRGRSTSSIRMGSLCRVIILSSLCGQKRPGANYWAIRGKRRGGALRRSFPRVRIGSRMTQGLSRIR
jgi:hypothetical protein